MSYMMSIRALKFTTLTIKFNKIILDFFRNLILFFIKIFVIYYIIEYNKKERLDVTMPNISSSYLYEWKEKTKEIIRMQYSDSELSDKKIDKYLDNIIEKNLKNPRLLLVNNYTNKISRVDTLQLIDIIRSKNLLCAGGGCLFVQHRAKRNILIEFILYVMDSRAGAKKLRKTFEKGTDEWEDADRMQLAFKLIINSLYGCLGYPGFIMFNIFLAEAITNQGKHIITSAINAIENFLGDSMYFMTSSEVFHVIRTIDNEFYQKTKGHFSDEFINEIKNYLDLDNLAKLCVDRYLSHCKFAYSPQLINQLTQIFHNMSTDELILMYYKNNFMEFTKLPFVKNKIKKLILMNGPLVFCEDDSFKNEECVNIVNDIWNLYELFVLYDYPIFDRIRKAAYLDKSKSLYTDTDSVFVSVDEFVKFVCNDIFPDIVSSNMSEENLIFTSANIALAFANRMIAKAMKTLCTSMNTTDEFAKLLKMKNEFFFSRIMFTEVKKRYISLAKLQEGQLLNNGEGLPEIKGFDFKKAGTKKLVKDFYTKLCLEEIMYPKRINPTRVFKKVLNLKYEMERGILAGNVEFFKQANVKKPEYYKNPYSTQGVCAILLWNTICPDKAIEFPSDVNIVPIKELTYEKPAKGKDEKDPLSIKNIRTFRDRYPKIYSYLNDNIYTNDNQLIKHITLSSIAIPKNIDYELPDYVTYLFDTDKIVNDNINLILPVLESIGINSLQVSATTSYMSNIVSI